MVTPADAHPDPHPDQHPDQHPASPARRLWSLLEPIHAVTYFSPEPLAALRTAGYRGFWMGYFAGRVAPLGAVGPEVARAVVYNFAADRVERALPAAWSFAPPAVALAARSEGSVAALVRMGVDAAAVRAADVVPALLEAALVAPVEGRALFAANRALPVPGEPVAALWHAATLLREHRGDGHVAALLAAGIGGRESHVLHAVATGFGADAYTVTRDFTAEEWAGCLASLTARGLVADGALTPAGRAVKQEVEDRTDALAAAAYAHLGAADVDRLADALAPLAAAVVRSGDIPVQSPMGLDLSSLA